MSQYDINKMNFKQLRNAVQELQDRLAIMQRKYEDILYNLDDDNIKSLSATKIKGTLSVDGAVITDSLYADIGDIADLTVNRISTSKKIYLYLTQNISDDNYFEGYDNGIYWIQATVVKDSDNKPLIEQLKNKDGETVYWVTAIREVREGVPYDCDGNRVGTTLKETDYPCMVYQYKKNIKAQFTYLIDKETGYANPQIVMGIGTDATGKTDFGKGFIYKDSESFVFKYINSIGAVSQIKIDEKGGHLVGDWDLSSDAEVDSLIFNENSFSYGIGDNTNTFVWSDDMTKLTNLTTGAVIAVTDNTEFNATSYVNAISGEDIENLFNDICGLDKGGDGQ